MTKTLVLFSAACAVALSVSCGGVTAGACVIETADAKYCHEARDKQSCDNVGGAHTADVTCESLGFPKSCPGDGRDVKRPADYACP